MRLLCGALALFVLGICGAAGAADPVFVTVQLPGAKGSSEPRIAVARDDVRWAVSNLPTPPGDLNNPSVPPSSDDPDAASGATPEIVYTSRDGGLTWQKTAGTPPQKSATIDTDIVTMPTGRVLTSELDTGGLNFPTATTDDGGKTWTESIGSTELADQDRQWFAVGPVPKGAAQPPVYLLYHNFASGIPQHNMWVSTSADGGKTFGPPVPTAQPGSEAYTDLQCSDSGGPSSITVNPKTGHIYVVFTTRAGIDPVTGTDAGGCGASVFGPLEFNIVNATRVWVADSPDGSIGSWHDTLAVDDAKTQQVVSQQLAYGTLDNQGNFYVAYPESPNAYPDLAGSALKLTWEAPDAKGTLSGTWSKPATLIPAEKGSDGKGQNGVDLVHVLAGDPGKIDVAYFKAQTVAGAKAPVWYTHVLQSFDAQSPTPQVRDYRISDIPTYQWTADEMMGICQTAQDAGPGQGVVAGLGCDRSTDVWGIALDAQCRLMVAWPARGTSADGGTAQDGATIAGHQDGTFVTTQTGGPTLCGSANALPGGSQAVAYQPLPSQVTPGSPATTGSGSGGPASSGGGCVDRVRPLSRPLGKVRAARTRITLHGSAIDKGCHVTGRAARLRVRSVGVAVGRHVSKTRCRFLRGNATFGPATGCHGATTYLVAHGTSSWSFSLKGHFPKGQYVVWTRATDVANNYERKAVHRNHRDIRLG
ncbi:MAG: collagen-like protein [Solirubrobacteraceae bacterium]|nr:collagen-like protein [Solirubrobacteraceae bacterium]